MGTMKHETLGEIVFKDTQKNISAFLQFGKVKKKPTDYFEG